MDGLASLMQQAPQGQPQQAPQAPMPGMNPRMDNAVEVVNNDIENLNLDPRTEYALKVQEASDLLASAERNLAMKQPQPTPPEIVDQRKQQVQQRIQQGVAGLLQQLMPGMQQRGMQMAAMQNPRPPMQAGLPTQAAPNMARMMDGGIVGYQEGGEVYDDIGAMAALYKQARDKTSDPSATAQEIANAQQQMEMIRQQAGARYRQVLERVDEMSGLAPMEMAGGGYVKRYQAGGMPLLDRLGALAEGLGIDDLFSPERYEREPSEEARRRNEMPGVMKSAIDPRTGEVVRRSELEPIGRGAAYRRRPEAEAANQLPSNITPEIAAQLEVIDNMPNTRTDTRVPEEVVAEAPNVADAFRFYDVVGDALTPNVDLLTGDTTEPAPTEQDELSSRVREEILANLTPPDAAAAEARAMKAAGYSEEEIAARQRIRERQAELNRQLGEAETRDPRGQRLDRLIAFLQGAGGATSTAQALRGAGIGGMQERRRQEAEDLQFAENRRARELELLGLEQADIEQDRGIRVQAYEMTQDAINNQRSSFNQAIQSATQLVRGEKSDEIERQANTIREIANTINDRQLNLTKGRYDQQDQREQAKILLETAKAMADNILSGFMSTGEEGYAEAQARADAVLNEATSLIAGILGIDPADMARLSQAAGGGVEAEANAILAGQR
jgi:hypothetical protein